MTRAGDGIYTKVWDDGIYTKVGGVLWSSAFLVFVSPGWGGPGRSGWMQADSGFHVEHLAVASTDAKRCKMEILAGSLDGASEDYIRQNHMGETSTHVLYACLDFPTLGVIACDTKKKSLLLIAPRIARFLPENLPNIYVFFH